MVEQWKYKTDGSVSESVWPFGTEILTWPQLTPDDSSLQSFPSFRPVFPASTAALMLRKVRFLVQAFHTVDHLCIFASIGMVLRCAKLDIHGNSLISRSSNAKPGRGKACNNWTRFKWVSTIFSRESFRRWCAWRPLIKPIFNGSHHRLPTRDWKESSKIPSAC